MPAIATTGSYLARMREAIKFAETNRERAQTIIADVRESVAHELMARYKHLENHRISEAQVSAVVDARVSDDPRFKAAVSNEQWGARLSDMYALITLVTLESERLKVQREQLAAQNETNRLLNLLLTGGRAPEPLTVGQIITQRNGRADNT